MNLKQLLEKLKALLAEMETAAAESDKEGATEEAKSTARKLYDAKSAEYAKVEGQIEVAKKIAANKKTIAEAETLLAVEPQGKTIPSGSVAAQAKDHDKDQAELEGQFTNWFCGKSLSGTAHEALAPKSKGWKDGATGIALPQRFADIILPERRFFGKALPLTSPQASPANLFQADFRKDMLQYPAEAAMLFPLCFKIPCSSGKVLWPKLKQTAPGAEGGADEFGETAGVLCGWTAEGAEKPGTEPTFEQTSISTHELSARTEITKTLLNRSTIDLPSLLNSLFRSAAMHKIDLAIINGDGVGKPKGVLQEAGIGAPARAAANNVGYADVVKLEHAIAPQFRARAVYAAQDKAIENMKLKLDGQNRPLFIPSGQSAIDGVKVDKINGYAVRPMQRMPALGAAGDVVFGDFSQYACPVEQEVVIAQSEHEKMSKGVVVFVMFVQIGGQTLQIRAFAKLAA